MGTAKSGRSENPFYWTSAGKNYELCWSVGVSEPWPLRPVGWGASCRRCRFDLARHSTPGYLCEPSRRQQAWPKAGRRDGIVGDPIGVSPRPRPTLTRPGPPHNIWYYTFTDRWRNYGVAIDDDKNRKWPFWCRWMVFRLGSRLIWKVEYSVFCVPPFVIKLSGVRHETPNLKIYPE